MSYEVYRGIVKIHISIRCKKSHVENLLTMLLRDKQLSLLLLLLLLLL